MTVTLERRSVQRLSRTTEGEVVPAVADRFTPLIAGSDPRIGWLATLVVTALAAVMRFWRLGSPHKFLFDETYYAKDAWSLINNGYVLNYRLANDKANEQILSGNLHDLWKDTPSMIVHPELGKWLIGLGEKAFGMEPFGWRVASAIVGSLMILVLIRLVRRLTGSTLLGCVAGLLLCFDGLQFVLSRMALLDGFMAFFMLCAVSCLIADRDWGRVRLARAYADGPVSGWGPVRGLRFRPWRLAAGIMFGLALATKWNAIYPLAAFGIWTYFQDAGARHALGVRWAYLKSLVVDAIPAFCYLVLVAGVVYLASWTGWLMHAHQYDLYLSNSGYGKYWGDWTKHTPHGFFDSLTQGLRSLYHYHLAVLDFHENGLKDATHAYQSNPRGWPLINKGVGVDVVLDIKPGRQGCDAEAGSTCLRQIILLGNPVLWWSGIMALVYAAYSWIFRRDWRFGLPVIGFLVSWIPWFRFDDRTIFFYYAIAMLPFTVIAITLALGRVLGPATATASRRSWGAATVGAYVALVVLCFAWFWPVYTDGLLTNHEWQQRIWFSRWI
ncbi:MAG: phospholipid carrier-dependent glycosyltransferase [Nocardioidaceae bacterium]